MNNQAREAPLEGHRFGDHSIVSRRIIPPTHTNDVINREDVTGLPFFIRGNNWVVRGDSRFQHSADDHNYIAHSVPIRRAVGGVEQQPAIDLQIGGYYPERRLLIRHEIRFNNPVLLTTIDVALLEQFMLGINVTDKQLGSVLSGPLGNLATAKNVCPSITIRCERYDNTALYAKALFLTLLSHRVQLEGVGVAFTPYDHNNNVQQVVTTNDNAGNVINQAIQEGRFIVVQDRDFNARDLPALL
ncbi:hypothetical protein TKK_0003892 [Trichogramma kaykai]